MDFEFNKIFFRPPPPTYKKSDFVGQDRYFEIPTEHVKTKAKMNIPCMLMPHLYGSDWISKYYIVYFHGNAEDLGTSYDFLLDLRNSVRCNIILTEYCGYGVYTDDSPNTRQIEYDAVKIFEYLRNDLQIPKQNIILLGRSMGSGPACFLASKHNPRGLMLISAFSSLKLVATNLVGHLSFLVSDRFRNIDCAKSIHCPVLFIHGKKDPLVPYQHSQNLADAVMFEINECFQDEMTHNEYDSDADIMNNITKFLNEKMQLSQKANDPLKSKVESFHQEKFEKIYPKNKQNSDTKQSKNDILESRRELLEIKKSQEVQQQILQQQKQPQQQEQQPPHQVSQMQQSHFQEINNTDLDNENQLPRQIEIPSLPTEEQPLLDSNVYKINSNPTSS